MNDIFHEFEYLHHFEDSLTFGVNAVLDNAFKVEQKVKYKLDLGITE